MTPDDTNQRFDRVVSVGLIVGLTVAVAGFALASGSVAQVASDFQVTIDSTNSPVGEGDTLEVVVTIENIGGTEDTQEISLDVAGQQPDSTNVTLAPGENTTETLTWQTGQGDTGDYTATVASEDDDNKTDVTVSPPRFDVVINATNSPVTEGSTLEVEAVIENRGSTTDNQEITLDVAGQERASTTVALDPGVTVTRNLTWTTEAGDEGDYTPTVSSETDSQTTSVTITDVSRFDVEIDSTNSPVVEGNELTVDVTVENIDSSTDTQDIELVIDGQERDTESVDLTGGSSTTVALEWVTETGDAGGYTANVSSETDNESTAVAVNAPPTATFTRDSAVPNRNEAVSFDAADSSDRDGTIVEYTWEVDGETVSGAETLSYTFTEAGEHEVTLTVTDDDGATATATRTVRVNAPPSASLPSVEATVDEAVTIEPDVSDDGKISRYEWSVDGEVVSTSETLTYTFDEAGTYQVKLQVTDDDGATAATTSAIDVASDATPTPTEPSPTDTESPTDEDQPGFGAGLALAAVLAVALLARRQG